MPSNKATSKKAATKKPPSKAAEKRKREAEEMDSNKRINSMFHSIDTQQYQQTLSQKSTQPEVVDISSQESAPDPSAQPPASSATAFTSTQTQAKPLSDIGDGFIKRDEEHFCKTYERYKGIYTELTVASPRLFIAASGVLVIEHLKSLGYCAEGMFRAIAMQHNGEGHGAVIQAWRCALDGKVVALESIHDNMGDSPTPIPSDWEEWTTEAEALDLIEAPIESLGLIQMQAVIRWSYRCACHLSTKAHFDPSFAILMYSMQYLERCGYGLDDTIKAMAMEILGKRQCDIDNAWEAARGNDTER